jgi:hypothetical protein
MKTFILSFVSLASLLFLPKQSIGQENGRVNYTYEEGLEDLIYQYRGYNKKNVMVDGYRIQIMFSNDKTEANNAKVNLYRLFPKENCYVDYEQPYYKLRMGDYTDRFQANYALQQLLATYPGAFIIKSKVSARR